MGVIEGELDSVVELEEEEELLDEGEAAEPAESPPPPQAERPRVAVATRAIRVAERFMGFLLGSFGCSSSGRSVPSYTRYSGRLPGRIGRTGWIGHFCV
ncbi:hypothetical protein NUM3379_40130 [Kineococcus sp. NUM-3379]